MIPTFTVSKVEKSDTLIHCFLQHMLINCENPPPSIKAKNLQYYQTSFENFVLPQEGDKKAVPCIVSFQRHTYGSFAIIRNLKQKEVA